MPFTNLLALLVMGATAASPVASSEKVFDIRVVCDGQTSAANQVWISSRSPDPADQAPLCIDKTSGLVSLPIASVDLGHNRVTDGFAVRLHVDPTRVGELSDLSPRVRGRELAFVKEGKYVAHARIYGPFDQGTVVLIVSDKSTGIKVAETLYGGTVAAP